MSNPPHSERGLSRVRLLVWPTIIAGPGLALLLGLGMWQLERLEWKNALIAERDSRMAAPVASFDNDSQPLGPLNFRRVSVRGEFLHHQEFHLLSRTSKGRAGIHVVTPLIPRPEIAGHPTILVNRGWVPNALSDPGRRHEGQTSGIVVVEGIARTEVGRQGWFAPENDPAGGVWHRLDVGQMSDVLGLPLPPFVIEAGPALNLGGFPIGGQTRVQIRNDHLGYAIIWYTLAAALAVIYLLFVRQKFMRQPMGTP